MNTVTITAYSNAADRAWEDWVRANAAHDPVWEGRALSQNAALAIIADAASAASIAADHIYNACDGIVDDLNLRNEIVTEDLLCKCGCGKRTDLVGCRFFDVRNDMSLAWTYVVRLRSQLKTIYR